MAIMNIGQRVSKLAHQNTSSSRDDAPSIIKKTPIKSGQVLRLLPPKQSSSKSQSLRLYL